MAPLIFILPGTGGLSESSASRYMAEQLFNKGYQTVTVDDAFSWPFAIAASQSGLPGYTPRDSEDLYKALQAISVQLKQYKQIQPRSYSMAGYSLGGLEIMFMHRMDEQQKYFNFNRVLLIDPPMDLMYAVKSLDSLYDVGQQLSPARQDYVFNRVIDVGQKYLAQHADLSNPETMITAFNELGLDNNDLSYLIGGSFRDSLRDVIFASQQINDLKILKYPATRFHRNVRLDEARKFSFLQYMSTFLYPEIQKQKGKSYSFQAMNEETSFYQFGKYVKTHQNIFIVHTADDFILKPGDIAWIQDTFGKRAVIFPHGGHCGAMNFPQFSDYLKTIF